MRDYAVLINALKAMSNTNSCFYCQGEQLVCEANGCILSNAADAIEELLAERDKALNRLCEFCGVCSEKSRSPMECEIAGFVEPPKGVE